MSGSESQTKEWHVSQPKGEDRYEDHLPADIDFTKVFGVREMRKASRARVPGMSDNAPPDVSPSFTALWCVESSGDELHSNGLDDYEMWTGETAVVLILIEDPKWTA